MRLAWRTSPTFRGRGNQAFPAVTGRAAGNQLPGITGTPPHRALPAPGYPGTVGGQAGNWQGSLGPDPNAPEISPRPHVSALGDGQETYRRFGIQGWNDKLTTRDRHAYWDSGNQRTGVDGSPHGYPNSYNHPRLQPPAPDLRLVNRTVSFQQGSDNTANQDDLSRPYTWLGEQGTKWSPVYGGVPGLYQPYGSRGGYPAPLVSPVAYGAANDGPQLVNSGLPHGLHTPTPYKGAAQLIQRYTSTQQMRPVRVDRPSNSPQAGQSFSQTVVPQGGSAVRPSKPPRGKSATQRTGGRGWSGTGGSSGGWT